MERLTGYVRQRLAARKARTRTCSMCACEHAPYMANCPVTLAPCNLTHRFLYTSPVMSRQTWTYIDNRYPSKAFIKILSKGATHTAHGLIHTYRSILQLLQKDRSKCHKPQHLYTSRFKYPDTPHTRIHIYKHKYCIPLNCILNFINISKTSTNAVQ